MNEQTEHLDQTEADILTYAVSDEALEAAADTERVAATLISWWTGTFYPLCCRRASRSHPVDDEKAASVGGLVFHQEE
jgi:hypothetical protein